MNKYKWIQIICWTIVFIVFIGLAVWFSNGFTFITGSNNIRIVNLRGPYNEVGRYSISVMDIDKLEVSWIAGRVYVTPYNGNDITLIEYAQRDLEENEILVYNTASGKLTVKYTELTPKFYDNIPTKRLEVLVPAALAEDFLEFKVNTVSASIEVSEIISDNMNISSISGNCNLSDLNAEEMHINTTSGNISGKGLKAKLINIGSISGKVTVNEATSEKISVDTTSGNATMKEVDTQRLSFYTISGDLSFDGEFDHLVASSASGVIKVKDRTLPKSLDINSMSGDVTVTMPDTDSIQLKYSTLSGKFSSDFPYLVNGNNDTYKISTASGNIKLLKLN